MREQAIPETHESALSHRSERLYTRQVLGPLLYIHPSQTHADSTRRDKNDIMTISVQLGRRLDY